MHKAIRIHENGGPEVLRYEDIEVAAPEPNEVQTRHTAIGANFIDVYDRTGLYPQSLPCVLGREAAGVVTAKGKKVRDLRVGDRKDAFIESLDSLRPLGMMVREPAGS